MVASDQTLMKLQTVRNSLSKIGPAILQARGQLVDLKYLATATSVVRTDEVARLEKVLDELNGKMNEAMNLASRLANK